MADIALDERLFQAGNFSGETSLRERGLQSAEALKCRNLPNTRDRDYRWTFLWRKRRSPWAWPQCAPQTFSLYSMFDTPFTLDFHCGNWNRIGSESGRFIMDREIDEYCASSLFYSFSLPAGDFL